MPRLLIVSFSVCPSPDRDGSEIVNLVKALGPRYQTDVLVVRGADQPFVERLHRARVLRVPVPGAGATEGERLEAFRRAARRQLTSEEYDLVHVRGAWLADAVLAALPPGVRLCYEPMPVTEAGDPTPGTPVDEAACCARAELLLVRSQPARRAYARAGLGERVVVIPPGVDVDRFDWEPQPAATGGRRVLYAGRIDGGAGLPLLVEAFARLRARLPARLLIAGRADPAVRRALDRAASEACVAGAIEWLGPIEPEDMPRAYATADVCVSVASPATAGDAPMEVPISMLEAMACRRAVVAPRVESIAGVVEAERDAVLYTPGDLAELARALERVLADDALRSRVAEAGYALVRQSYAASAVRRHVLAAYARLVPPAAWPAPVLEGPSDSTPTDAVPRPVFEGDTRPTLVAAVVAAVKPERETTDKDAVVAAPAAHGETRRVALPDAGEPRG